MKLLVVDDEPLARERLKRLLAARGDCTAVADAANGIEAIAANTTHEPDVILLVVGGPTHAFGMSRPRTREDAMKQKGDSARSSGSGMPKASARSSADIAPETK